MGRRLRSYLPGVAFHVTARTQGREPLFVGREERVVDMIRETTLRNDLRVDAFVVMPNHLHLVVTQGEQHLSDYMQALLCRVALCVQRELKREGHVFERRYRETPCFDAEYYRNAIAYVHLNPVRAGITTDANEHAWSSHGFYVEPSINSSTRIAAEDGLRVFADRPDDSLDACRLAYGRFIAWRLGVDRYRAAEGIGVPLPPLRPRCDAGDVYWAKRQPSPDSKRSANGRAVARADLRDVAASVLSASAREMSIELLRSGDRGREVVRVRREAIARALLVGYRPQQIARFFQVSASAVSHVAAGLRCGRPLTSAVDNP